MIASPVIDLSDTLGPGAPLDAVADQVSAACEQVGSFIITGPELWTDGRWRSTMHRVVTSPIDADPEADRVSLVFFFFNQSPGTALEPLPSCSNSFDPPARAITAAEHLEHKLSVQRSSAADAETSEPELRRSAGVW